jgi:octanoyl-[GcvH]:protein N-octanoyltransferase
MKEKMLFKGMQMSTQSLLQAQPAWRLINQTNTDPSFAALYSFAIDDTLCTAVGTGMSEPVVRAWIHHSDVVLGSRDYRLSNVDSGIQFLSEKGFRSVVRNSGGAAVPLDSGVLNLSLILPAPDWASDIHAGFAAMVELVRAMLEPFQTKVDVGEIAGSFCPGDFDLSIDGKKFAGLAQRRRKGAVSVQAFLIVEGQGAKRTRLIHDFYEKSAGAPQDIFPHVRQQSVTSLAEAIDPSITCHLLMQQLRIVLDNLSDNVTETQLMPEEIDEFNENTARMRARNPHLAE